MTTKLTHPADGIYAMSLARLGELKACKVGRDAFEFAAHRWSTEVDNSTEVRLRQYPLTLQILLETECLYKGACSWLLNQMFGAEKITHQEWNVATDATSWPYTPPVTRAKAVMALLLVRAKREGLVS